MVRLDAETFERALAEANAQERSVSFIIRRALKEALERAEKSKADFERAQRAVSDVLQKREVSPNFKKGGKNRDA